ncbi:hypothetical protein [Nocardia sp. NBC_01329]|uniref:hypothetical protein n=1 Tax=Nocardia sp. NBC_01329 TaxID=2903594 RepID=UPI002E162448|nr:hypothetical protein OG405_14095 [Nocardia sp. NBC_01329]
MTMPATGTGLDRAGPAGPRSAAARRRIPDPAGSRAVDDAAADVHWPDPSPLHHWWTEVMDGAPLPRPLRAA